MNKIYIENTTCLIENEKVLGGKKVWNYSYFKKINNLPEWSIPKILKSKGRGMNPQRLS